MTSQGATSEPSNFNPSLDLYWLHPVHCTNVDRIDPEHNEIFHRSLKLPVKPEIFDYHLEEGYRFNRSQWVVMCLNLIIEQELLKHRWRPPIIATNGLLGFTEYGIVPKARFSESGHRVATFKSIEDITENQEILTDEYKSAPIEAKIYVKPNFVSCRYAVTSEQEGGREIMKITATVKIPEKSVHVDFIHRHFTLETDEKVMAVLQ